MTIQQRNLSLGILAAIVLAIIIFFGSAKTTTVHPDEATSTAEVATTTTPVAGKVPVTTNKVTTPLNPGTPIQQTGKMYKEFVRPTGFSNTRTLNLLGRETFTLKDFVGKRVILLNFWTTSSSNALRTVPYLNGWDLKYGDKGLLVISIHVPRFSFERAKDVVDRTAYALNMTHPIVLDNDYETWKAYGNTVWPHQYLIDISGRIVYDHAGEGSYEATETKIQQLLLARTQVLGLPKETYAPFTEPKGVARVDLTQLKSPETYFGSLRNATLGNAVPMKEGTQDLVFESTASPKLNAPLLNGSWTFAKEYAMPQVANGAIRYRYTAKAVYGVFNSDRLIRVKVLRDGAPLAPEVAGADIRFEKGESYFYVSGARIYDLVNDKSGYGTHTLDIVSDESGLMVYTITFG